MSDGYLILEHPSDLGIEARGSTLARAFEQAAIALMATILDPRSVQPRAIRKLSVTGEDREHLLVRWLTEILYLYDGQGFAGREFAVSEFSDTSLRATVMGEMFDAGKHATRLEVKAITYHQLVIERPDTDWRVRVFLDI